MIASPSLLAHKAREAGIKVPQDPDNFDKSEYPHFFLFLNVQLGTPMPSPDAATRNAELIRELTPEETRTITYTQLRDRGLLV